MWVWTGSLHIHEYAYVVSRSTHEELEVELHICTCFLYRHCHSAAAAAKSLQSCPTLCDPIDGSPPGSPVPRIPQARTLDWVAISFSNAWKWKVKVQLLSRVRLFATPRTAACQAPPSMGFSRQEYWSGVPLPSFWLLGKNRKGDYMPTIKQLYGHLSFLTKYTWFSAIILLRCQQGRGDV